MAKPKPDDVIEHSGDTWRILSLGVEDGDRRFAHLASTTRYRQQRNGRVPIQICDWIPNAR